MEYQVLDLALVGFTGLTWAGSSLAPTGASVDVLAERADFVRDRAGDRFDDIEPSILTQVVSIGADTEKAVSGVAFTFGAEPDLVRSSPLTPRTGGVTWPPSPRTRAAR